MMYHFTHLLLIKMIIFTIPLEDCNLLFSTQGRAVPPSSLVVMMNAFVHKLSLSN